MELQGRKNKKGVAEVEKMGKVVAQVIHTKLSAAWTAKALVYDGSKWTICELPRHDFTKVRKDGMISHERQPVRTKVVDGQEALYFAQGATEVIPPPGHPNQYPVVLPGSQGHGNWYDTDKAVQDSLAALDSSIK